MTFFLSAITTVGDETSQVTRFPSARSRQWSNTDLVEGLKKRDDLAAAAFFDNYAASINGLVWKLLGVDDDHDDVVNQVFMAVLGSVGGLKDAASFPFWVKQVTVNTVRKEIRRRVYRRRLLVLQERPGDDTPAGAAPADLTERVYKVLRKMKTEHQLVFALRFIGGHTHREVARICEFSLATSKRKVGRARAEFLKRAKDDVILAGHIEEMEDD